MASFSGSLASDGTIRWEFSALENPVSAYSFRVSTSDGNSTAWSDGTTYDFTYGHSCGTTIIGYGYATYAGTEYYIGNSSVATQACPISPPTGTPSVSATYNPSGGVHYINVYWNTIPNATYYNVYANNNSGSGDVLKATTSATSQQITVDIPNKTYTIKVQACNSGGCSSSLGSADVNTSTRPLPFSWSLPKTAGSNMQVSATEWTNLQDNVNKVRVYKNLTTYSFTGVYIGMQANQAYLFNQVINAIGEMNASVYPIVNTSTNINDSALFARILNSLNAIT